MRNSYKTFFGCVISICLGFLSIAYYAEYIQGIPPCSLCTYQRIVYYGAMFMAIIGLLWSSIAPRLIPVFYGFFVLQIGLSIWLILVEHGYILYKCQQPPITNLYRPAPSSCASNSWVIFGFPTSILHLGVIVLFFIAFILWRAHDHKKNNP